jgi:hypothetical protein
MHEVFGRRRNRRIPKFSEMVLYPILYGNGSPMEAKLREIRWSY